MVYNRTQTIRALKAGISQNCYRTFLWELEHPSLGNLGRATLLEHYAYIKKIGRPKGSLFDNFKFSFNVIDQDFIDHWAIEPIPTSPTMQKIIDSY